jgi:adenylate cyclase
MPTLRQLLARIPTKGFRLVGLGLTITVLTLVAFQSWAPLKTAEYFVYDFHFQLRGQQQAPSDIVVAGVDATSIHDLNHGESPLPRHFVGNALRLLCRAHARAVGIDFLYENASTYGAPDDRSLIGGMKSCADVVQADEFGGSDQSSYVAAETNLIRPIDPVAKAVRALGLANVPQDVDGGVRRADLVQYDLLGHPYPSLALQLASVALNQPWQQVVKGLPQQGMYINYRGPQDPSGGNGTFPSYQFEGLAQPQGKGQDSPTVFHNKIVLIIPATISSHDQYPTPFGSMFGGVVQANTVETIMHRDPITPAGSWANGALLILVGLFATLSASRFGIYRSAGATLLVALGLAILTQVAFVFLRLWFNLLAPETTVILVFAAIMALRFATEQQQRRRTSKIFGQYVKPEIVDILVNTPDEETALAGARRPISVLFADVRGFTAMSEHMEPEQVVSALDIYLEELTAAVQAHDGTLDKYVGDELMAIWNAPRYQDDHAMRAVETGLDMISRTDHINQQLASQGLPPMRYGIGINTGEAVVGQMGSSFRKQYDVIGDTVNTAARLCSAAAGAELIIGQDTWEAIGDRLVVEETDPLSLKGKSQKLRTYRVLTVKSAAVPVAQPHPVPA